MIFLLAYLTSFYDKMTIYDNPSFQYAMAILDLKPRRRNINPTKVDSKTKAYLAALDAEADNYTGDDISKQLSDACYEKNHQPLYHTHVHRRGKTAVVANPDGTNMQKVHLPYHTK